MNDLYMLSILVILGAIILGLLSRLIQSNTIGGKRQYDITKIDIGHIDKMKGREFEEYLHVLLTCLGYKNTYLTPETNDYGADIIFTDSKGREIVLQAKRYTTRDKNSVSVDGVQQVHSARTYYNADHAICITSTKFSSNCIKLANVTNVTLIDREGLKEIIKSFKSNNRSHAISLIEQTQITKKYSHKQA